MDPTDPDSGYPTPRDEEDELNTTTQSEFNPLVTSTPKEPPRVPRLNLHRYEGEGLNEVHKHDVSSEAIKRRIHGHQIERELNRTKAKYEKLQQETNEIKNENSRLHDSLNTTVADADNKDATIEELNQSVANMSETIESKNKEIQEERERSEKAIADYQEVKLIKEETERELDVHRNIISKDRKERDEIQERVHQLEEELKAAQVRATFEADENTKKAKELASTKEELEKSKKEVARLSTQIDNDKQTSDEKIRASEESASRSSNERQQIEHDHDTAVQELKNIVEQKETLETLVSELRKKEQSLGDQIKTMEKDISDYVKTCDDWKREAEEFKSEAETVLQERNSLTASLGDKNVEIGQLQHDLGQAQADLEDISKKYTAQSTELEVLNAKEQLYIDSVKEMNDWAEQKKIADDELKAKTDILAEKEKTIQSLQKETSDMNSKIDGYEAGRVEFESTIKQLNDTFKQQNAVAEESRQMEKKLIDDQVQLRNEISANKNEIVDLHREISRLKEDKKALKDQVCEDATQSNLLEAERYKNSQLTNQIAELEKINRGIVDENTYLRNEFGNRPHVNVITQLHQELDEKTAILEQNEQVRQSWTAELEQLKSENLAQKEELDNKNTEIANLLDDTRLANDEILKQKNIIENMFKEHMEFEADVHRELEEYEAAKIRLQELEAIDGYPGQSVRVETSDASTNTSEPVGQSTQHLIEQLNSLTTKLAEEQNRTRQLNNDLRDKNGDCCKLNEELDSLSRDLAQAEQEATYYKQNCNQFELQLHNADTKTNKLNEQRITTDRAIMEMKQFILVENPMVIDTLEKDKRNLNADIERLQRKIISYKDHIQSRDDQISIKETKINQLKQDLTHVSLDLKSKRQLIHINQETVAELLVKMKDQEKFIERCRNRNTDRQAVIEKMEEKLRNAYVYLGREPTFGKLPEKKERWSREDEADNLALDTITNQMNNILRSRNTQMFRDARSNLAEEHLEADVTQQSGDLTRLSQRNNPRRSGSIISASSRGQSRASSVAESRMNLENLSRSPSNSNSHSNERRYS